MKKYLLLSALAVSALAAQAEYGNYFYCTYNGEKIENGATVVCNHYIVTEYEDWDNIDPETGMGLVIPTITYDLNLKMVNPTEEDQYCIGGMYYSKPTAAEFPTAVASYTSVAFCSAENCFMPSEALNNCGYTNGLKVEPGDKAEWLIHLNNAPMGFTEATFEVKLQACERVDDPKGSINDYDGTSPYDCWPLDDGDYNFFIKFVKDNTSVAGLNGEAAAPEYFNLQGMRVAEPENGLYIVRRGATVTKELIRK